MEVKIAEGTAWCKSTKQKTTQHTVLVPVFRNVTAFILVNL